MEASQTNSRASGERTTPRMATKKPAGNQNIALGGGGSMASAIRQIIVSNSAYIMLNRGSQLRIRTHTRWGKRKGGMVIL